MRQKKPPARARHAAPIRGATGAVAQQVVARRARASGAPAVVIPASASAEGVAAKRPARGAKEATMSTASVTKAAVAKAGGTTATLTRTAGTKPAGTTAASTRAAAAKSPARRGSAAGTGRGSRSSSSPAPRRAGKRAATNAASAPARPTSEARAAAGKPRVRDRILETAGDLFYTRGIHCVGVDCIASEAGTNKMSLYRNFPSKEELVAEYLREQERDYWAAWEATVAPFAGDPRRQLEALFDGFLARAQSEDQAPDDCKVRRGCALGNAAVEIAEDDESLRAIVLAYKSELRRRLRALARAAGASDADGLGDALMLLLEGGCYTLSTFPSTSGPIASMPGAARALLSAYVPPAE